MGSQLHESCQIWLLWRLCLLWRLGGPQIHRYRIRQSICESSVELELAKEVTIDLKDSSLSDAILQLRRQSNLTIIVDPKVIARDPGTFSLKVDKMQMRHVLGFIEKLTGTTHAILDNTYLIHANDAGDFHGADAGLQARMAQQISFEFQSKSLSEVVKMLSKVCGFRIVAAVAARSSLVTLKVTNMPFGEALHLIGAETGTTVRYVEMPAEDIPAQDTSKTASNVPTARPPVPTLVFNVIPAPSTVVPRPQPSTEMQGVHTQAF